MRPRQQALLLKLWPPLLAFIRLQRLRFLSPLDTRPQSQVLLYLRQLAQLNDLFLLVLPPPRRPTVMMLHPHNQEHFLFR
jgi:hypothetical protein